MGKRISALMKNIHKGERCFILGNGPGLDRYDLRLLFNEYTFGTNLGFRKWVPVYYVCCNPLVYNQYADEIDQLNAGKFKFLPGSLSWTSQPIFQTDSLGPFWQGWTVTYVCLQLAFIMGFDPVYLIGVDHDYGEVSGDPNSEQRYPGGDQAHAAGAGYDGGVWNLPDLERSYEAYQKAQRAFVNAGRKIYIIPPTKLDIFEEVTWKSLGL